MQIKSINSLYIQSNFRLNNNIYNKNNSIDNSLDTNLNNIANYVPISFGAKQQIQLLLKQSEQFNCAYTGKKLLSPEKAKNLYNFLNKQLTAKATLNILEFLQKDNFLPIVEDKMYNIFKEEAKDNETFKDVLQRLKPQAEIRLKNDTTQILKENKKLVKSFSNSVSKTIEKLYTEALKNAKNGTFDKNTFIDEIQKTNFSIEEKDEKLFKLMLKNLYKIPDENNSTDVFIVNNASLSHRKIAKKIISSTVATIRKLTKDNDNEKISNSILVSTKCNEELQNISLENYLTIYGANKVIHNIREYLYNIKNLSKDKKSIYYDKKSYIEHLAGLFQKEIPNFKIIDIYKSIPVKNQKEIKTSNRKKMLPGMSFILSYADNLNCAYTGKRLISPKKANNIYTELEKRANSQSVINYLSKFSQTYMHDLESTMFDILKSETNGNDNFKDILNKLKPEALKRLQTKQMSLLKCTEAYRNLLSPIVAEEVDKILQTAIERINSGTFNKDITNKLLSRIPAENSDKINIKNICNLFNNMPSEKTDLDAFIVENSQLSHFNIAKRLVSPSVAMAVPIVPIEIGGQDKLSNYILISTKSFQEQNISCFTDCIKTNSDNVIQNLQKYIDDINRKSNKPGSNFASLRLYPKAIQSAILQETNGKYNLHVEVNNSYKLRKNTAHKKHFNSRHINHRQ